MNPEPQSHEQADMIRRIDNMRRMAQEKDEREGKQLKPAAKKNAEIIQFSLFPPETRPASNPLVRSSLFAAIRGKDRQLLDNYEVATVDGWKITFSGEQFNQDDKDTLMQLVFMAGGKSAEEYLTIPAHAILRALGRDTGGKAHQTLKEEIERLVKGTIKLESKDVDYIGHFIDDATQDKTSRSWVFRINPRFAPLFAEKSYTLIDWEQRKRLKNKYLARWLQLELGTHAAPFARSVDFYREKSGSRAARLCDFRKALCSALNDLNENGDITGWTIDATDLVHIERIPSLSQQKHITSKTPTKRPRKG
jgi:TrfA protein